MNTFWKKTFTLVALVFAGTASAHDQLGNLGKSAGATDLYIVTCSNDGSGATAKLSTSVTVPAGTTANGVKVSVRTVAIRPPLSFKATNTTDAYNTDLLSSPVVNTLGTDGDFYVSVGKSATGLAAYQLAFHCLTSTNAHTGADIMMVQNQ